METKDLIIIGGGICGMTAAIYAARANIAVTIIEKDICGGLVNSTHTVENVPSYPSIHGLELMEKCRTHVEALGVEIIEVEQVLGVDFSTNNKSIRTTDDTYHAKAVIIATGRSPVPMPVQTNFEKIHYCSVCDGTAYKGKDVIVIGGGNSAFDESLYLLGIGVRSIHIFEIMPHCIAAASTQAKVLATGMVTVHTSTKISSIDTVHSGKGFVHYENIADCSTSALEVDAVFCFMGQQPNTTIFDGILNMEHGYITTTVDMETTVAGIFAAGDVTAKKYRQITTAMGDGTIAALSAEKYIRNNV